MRRFSIQSLMAIAVLSLLTIDATAQHTKTIRFKNAPESYAPVHYRIEKVVDKRTDTSNIGIMRAGLTNKPVPVNFAGGLAAAMLAYIQHNVTIKNDAEPLDIYIKELKITETSTGMKERATLDYALQYVKGEQPLFVFNGNAYVETGMDASAYIERLVRQGMGATLRQMDDNWLQASALMAPPSITVKVVIDTIAAGTRIAYSKTQLLTLADFNGVPDDLSRGAAATYSGTDIKYYTQTIGNKTMLTVHLLPYADKSKSWARPQSRTPQVLAHEQRHFDITAAHACILKHEIESYRFTPEQVTGNAIESIMSSIQARVQQQSEGMQRSYDTETGHGVNTKVSNSGTQRLHPYSLPRPATD